MPVYWSDDFETTTALSLDYTIVVDMVKSAGIGPDGSQGITGAGTNSQKYYAEIDKRLTPNSRQGYVSLDIKASTTLATGSFGHWLLEVRSPTDVTFLDLYTAGATPGDWSYSCAQNFGDIAVVLGGTCIVGISGAYAGGTYFTLEVEFETSSILAGVRQADGWVKVWVDDVLEADLTGQVFGAYHAINNPNNYWGNVIASPQGDGDNFYIANTRPAASAGGGETSSVFVG